MENLNVENPTWKTSTWKTDVENRCGKPMWKIDVENRCGKTTWKTDVENRRGKPECDDPSGFIPKKKKSVPSKPEMSTETQASGSEKIKPKGEKGADGRRNDGGKNVKPPGSDHQRRNNQFTAFPKRHGPSHVGLGHAPPSVGVYSNMSVKQFLYGSSVNDEDGNVVLSARRTGNLYTTVFRSIPQTHTQFEALSQSVDAICLLTKASKEDSWLWHRTLCQQNFKDMNKLVSKRLVSGLPETRLSKDTLCSVCEQGKMKRSSHPLKMETNCKNPLDMIHMDLCGPMRVESLARKNYMLVLIDEFSRFTWFEFLRAKFDTTDRIIAFIKRIQILLGHKVNSQ
ncbi:hypothetical protein OSB04_016535 [Centaurea solstitialis]|uniref:GAG-pre-integrase domain-containing protein n=1 Tax=Centaurea solstitialis TaxID=347529 RepID=A0AA38TD08_9ASTR|nr:hypothetical protein OSB04_016535 [Centaurea solstitialis]